MNKNIIDPYYVPKDINGDDIYVGGIYLHTNDVIKIARLVFVAKLEVNHYGSYIILHTYIRLKNHEISSGIKYILNYINASAPPKCNNHLNKVNPLYHMDLNDCKEMIELLDFFKIRKMLPEDYKYGDKLKNFIDKDKCINSFMYY